mmetsp:Transcript_24413/g.81932  ORF Transcript_24413/g.81932 Transcript_24413/m.81932 type:complete len:133 (-) Transcript_24413:297-695(-)
MEKRARRQTLAGSEPDDDNDEDDDPGLDAAAERFADFVGTKAASDPAAKRQRSTALSSDPGLPRQMVSASGWDGTLPAESPHEPQIAGADTPIADLAIGAPTPLPFDEEVSVNTNLCSNRSICPWRCQSQRD